MIKKNRWTPDQALTELKRWCASQERSHEAVRTKLYERGIYGDEMENIIATLISENFLNELRYARAYVSGKFKINNWGRNKILAGLKMEKISSYNINKAMQSIDEDAYAETLIKLIEKKEKTLSGTSLEKKKKLFAYLLQKGYEYQNIQNCIDDLESS